MLRTRLTNCLLIIIILMALCGLLIYSWGLPYYGQGIINSYPEFSHWYWPWLIFLWCTGVPCYIVLYFMGKILQSVRKGNAFTEDNAQRFKRIAQVTAADVALFLAGNIVFMLLNMNHPSVLLCSLGIAFVGVVIAVVSLAFSHLTLRAAALQEQYDLTI